MNVYLTTKEYYEPTGDRKTHLTANLLAGRPCVAHAGVVLGEATARERRAGLRHGEEIAAGLRAGTAVGFTWLLGADLFGVKLAERRAVVRLAGL